MGLKVDKRCFIVCEGGEEGLIVGEQGEWDLKADE